MKAEPIQEIYTVSNLNSAVRNLLENNFFLVWVEGEISNFAAPHSGHWYFSLKDAGAQVRCAMFKGNQRKLVCCPKDGMHVLIKARVSLYENRGEYQLIVDSIEEQGEGKLRLAFEVLKKKLAERGWFDAIHKKKLPLFPHTIGIITSSTGAALRDILHVLNRRYPQAFVIIYPTLVQGDLAAPMIAKTIQIANQRKECDVLILARGGGSLEDLWPFNEEIVASAIFHSELPIISGVGHEIDFTIADFVADRRAPTPSAAAEITTPDKTELLAALLQQEKQIIRKIKTLLIFLKQKIDWTTKNLILKDPKRSLREKMQCLDLHESTLTRLQYHFITQRREQLNTLQNRLYLKSPLLTMPIHRQALNHIKINLQNEFNNFLIKKHTLLKLLANKLHTLSPLATLERGYAIVMDKNNLPIPVTHLNQQDTIHIRLKSVLLHCMVTHIENIDLTV